MDVTTPIKALWAQALDYLRTLMSQQDIERWILPIRPVSLQGVELTLHVPSQAFSDRLEELHSEPIMQMLHHLVGANASIIITYPKETVMPTVAPTGQAMRPGAQSRYETPLNDALRFETFIEGTSNHYVRVVAEGIALNPGKAPTNIFFVHGPSGVGKTHLSQAIGHRVRELHPHLRVCYVPSSQFENQYVRDAQTNKAGFIEYYQQVDVLIIDDIQSLLGKHKTQMAFFDIFNHLYLLNKQIILTSDMPPVALEGMEERMITRIQSSIALPLERPDLPLRRKILHQRVAESGVELGEEVAEFIVTRMERNVRELEGTLRTLLTISRISERTIDINLARSVMAQSIVVDKPEVTMEQITQCILRHYSVDEDDLKGKSRKATIVIPRQLVMYFTQKYTKHSLSDIGLRLGRRDHTTVLHGVRTIESKIEQDEELRQIVEQIAQELH